MKKDIYLAGGCFWGTEKYLSEVSGILETEVGYANGRTNAPTYEEVCHKNTGHAETVKVSYDDQIIGLPYLLDLYYDVINPISLNRQGADVGSQYRTGIYFVQNEDLKIIQDSIEQLQHKFNEKIAIEVLPLSNYARAEEYHQHYLDKNPSGYCHISKQKVEQAKIAVDDSKQQRKPVYLKSSREELKKRLDPLSFEVTQNAATESPYTNPYDQEFRKGIYVDITTKEPLFASTAKFDSGCGWPAFSKPIDRTILKEKTDISHGMVRTEVKSALGDAHLGHVFTDGPLETGGLRYCINSASLLFIPYEEMEESGYGYLKKILDEDQKLGGSL